MIELKKDTLVFSFPEVHPEARFSLNFQRTLRIPDDGKIYPLPPGLDTFPLEHIDDYKVPASWQQRGGVMLPMYQSEAMWISFQENYIRERGTSYPFAVKIATGKINALTGDFWTDSLKQESQDYMVSTKQPWLDGYCVEKDLIRQFVAMPLGSGYSAEEQITGEVEHGGLQIIVYPMKREIFEKRFPIVERLDRGDFRYMAFENEDVCLECNIDMGLAPGGKMHQEIYEDPFRFSDWDQSISSRCFIHIANSLVWRAVTGKNSPSVPLTADEYTRYGFPWFDYYNDNVGSLEGSEILKKLKSVIEKSHEKGDNPLPENESVETEKIINMVVRKRVREGSF